jgi:hypothetical protein
MYFLNISLEYFKESAYMHINHFSYFSFEKNSLKKLDLPEAFGPLIVSAVFRGPKKFNNFAKFRIPKTREKLAKLETGEISNDLQGLSIYKQI